MSSADLSQCAAVDRVASRGRGKNLRRMLAARRSLFCVILSEPSLCHSERSKESRFFLNVGPLNPNHGACEHFYVVKSGILRCALNDTKVKSRRRKPSTPTTKRLLARAFPIIEHDPSPTAIIEPHRVYKRIDIPKHCVLCFFQDVIDDLVLNGGAREIDHDMSEVGRHPMYEVEIDGKRLAVVHPRVGAAIAAAMFDRLIARGARKFIACGGAGVLDSKIAVGHLIVPNSAVRD